MSDWPYTYKLVGKLAVPCDPHDEDWYKGVGAEVAKTELPGPVYISTIFMGLDLGLPIPGHPPLLFETMLFEGETREQWRYTTWEEAEAGHAHVVAERKAKP